MLKPLEIQILERLAECFPDAMILPMSYGAENDILLRGLLESLKQRGLVELAFLSETPPSHALPQSIQISQCGIDYLRRASTF